MRITQLIHIAAALVPAATVANKADNSAKALRLRRGQRDDDVESLSTNKEAKAVMNEELIKFWDRFLAEDGSMPPPTDPKSVVDIVVKESDLSTLESAVIAANLADALSGDGPFTVFAPINDAFAALPQEYVQMLLTPPWILHLQDLLSFHVASGSVLSTDLNDGMEIQMLNTEDIEINISGDSVTISSEGAEDDSQVVEADLIATNGVVHKIDGVLLPLFTTQTVFDFLDENDNYSTLADLLVAAELDEAVRTGTLTLLAPTNEAFDKLPSDTINFLTDPANADDLRNILLYHVIEDVIPSVLLEFGTVTTLNGQDVEVSPEGTDIRFNDIQVTKADILAMNGIIHTLNDVLIPPTDSPSPPNTVTRKGTITITNMAPEKGTCQTPVWVGIHAGTFDLYNRNKAASAALESLAEDGNSGPISADFASTSGTVWDGTVGSAPFCSGETAELAFEIDVVLGVPHYFSYASMVLPSNDAFVANGDPTAHEIFNAEGDFVSVAIDVMGRMVLDAGTEVNDEIPENTAFFGQTEPNTGKDENSVVARHAGFNAVGSGGILDSEDFVNADFTADGYQMMRITVTS